MTKEERPASLDLDKGMAAAFGAPKPTSESVLQILQARSESKLGVHLPDSEGPAGAPVRVDDDAKALRDASGRYQVLGEIARGGMGVVYKGRDVDLGRDVAMKVLHEKFGADSGVLERFVEEAQIGGQLQHPGIVPVYERRAAARTGAPYFAMKLVKGETLVGAADEAPRPRRGSTPLLRHVRAGLPDDGLRAHRAASSTATSSPPTS